ncbi:HAMP domain-containing sensor histidine kinase [Nakamurella deserti]|uniref:HAMP domain-containing sensor histidine kinase n=1 Tax=Nakamurella deserti TaxID=2164074 RepID=UPI000DBE4352|nr:HAMP domain-containing sensor histidine kinase [Nakamurella deserti]
MTAPRPGRALRTTSLTRRVLLSSLTVLMLVLGAAGILTDVLVGAQLRSDAMNRLTSRADLAQQALTDGADAGEIVAAAKGDGVTVSLLRGDGRVVGDPAVRPAPPGPGGPAGPVPPVAADTLSADRETLTRRLSDGTLLTVAVDTAGIGQVRGQLRAVLYPLLIGALVLAGLLLLVATRTALRPLDRMTALAGSITGGQRGRRLGPSRTDTELGRTAAAFDGMLDALEGAEAAARQSERRTRQFVADAAHELRTPIAGVRAAAEAVLSAGADVAAQERERLELLVVREARRAGRLVEDLLSLAGIESGLALRVEPVELSALLAAEVERTRLVGRAGLGVELDARPCTVPADPVRLGQVVANLLDNARRYTDRPGRVRVHLDRDPDGVRVLVVDDGPGVPAADRERIFDRLVRLDRARVQETVTGSTSGSGLGLSIARGIARAHGGDLLCVEPPAPWTGAAFVLSLPTRTVSRADPATSAEAPSRRVPGPGGSRNHRHRPG